jgi:3-deoxy-D-arabino-heptulosonate 7-phosphate (DAHP) synthase class II
MFLGLFKLLESLPLKELVRRTDTLEAAHLEVLEEVEVPVACCCGMWLSIDIGVVN